MCLPFYCHRPQFSILTKASKFIVLIKFLCTLIIKIKEIKITTTTRFEKELLFRIALLSLF